jgi:hypothetical protein
MLRIITAMTLLGTAVLLTGQAEGPRIPDEMEKRRALSIAYAMNGFSMVRWGSIDLSSLMNPLPADDEPRQFIGPSPPRSKRGNPQLD